MTKVQFIRTPHGDELAALPREECERLTALAAEAEEDAGTRRLVGAVRRTLDERREVQCDAFGNGSAPTPISAAMPAKVLPATCIRLASTNRA